MSWRALIVDDDAEVLASMHLRGRRHRSSWAFVPASSGTAAIDRLTEEPFDLVLTDLTMPGVSGAEVLARARAERPAALRFVLSGRADRSLLRDAANAHQVFTKPADLDEVVARAELALKARASLTPEEIDCVTSGAGVPPSPRIFATLHAALATPEYKIDAIARIVEQDLALTSRVLQLASSSALGPRRTVSSVRSAVIALGKCALEHLVLVEEAITPPTRLGGSDLRAHALLVGRIALALEPNDRRGFVAGVLHDLGHRVCEEVDEPGGRHALLGSYLAAIWGFPPAIVEAIRDHHTPPVDRPPTLSGIVWAADRIADFGASALEDGSIEAAFGAEVALAWRAAGLSFLSRSTNEVGVRRPLDSRPEVFDVSASARIVRGR